MKEKIILLSLDNRPCNYDFPYQIFAHEGCHLIRMEKQGDKKVPVEAQEIKCFLEKEAKDAYGIVLSMDMLYYGGLVPSRIHEKRLEELKTMAEILKNMKKENPTLIIYAFQVVMRCPNYSSLDEEPDYYETYGEWIHEAGEMIHKSRLGLCSEKNLDKITEKIPQKALEDYIERRQVNQFMNQFTIEMVKRGMMDALVIPQDDSAVYGYAAMDQEEIRKKIQKENLSDQILMYPGADEVGMSLMSRMFCHVLEKKPKIYVKYLSEAAKYIIPLYEGNQLCSMIKSHILSAGGQLTDTYETADIILLVTAPAGAMKEASIQPANIAQYYAERNLYEFCDFIKERKKEGKIVTIADNAYANGGDLEILRILNKNHLLLEVDGYAGWNTSANTIGTAIALGIDSYLFGTTKEHQMFLMQRYIEDVGYCSVVRQKVTSKLKDYGYNYFYVKEQKGEIAALVEKELELFCKKELSSIADQIKSISVSMPWKRMFELALTLQLYKEKEEDGFDGSKI